VLPQQILAHMVADVQLRQQTPVCHATVRCAHANIALRRRWHESERCLSSAVHDDHTSHRFGQRPELELPTPLMCRTFYPGGIAARTQNTATI
jgi:hypothetical protein